ncbi:MAG: PHP domain-containing protein [Candidatus Eisenbacteria bacterium]
MDFVPLKIQTRFSPLLSSIEPDVLARRLGELGFRAAGVADRGVLLGAAAAAGAFGEHGIALAAGAEVAVRFPRPGGDLLPANYTLTLFPETEEGSRNLDLLLERIQRAERPPLLRGTAEIREIEEHAPGLLALSGGLTGPVSGAFARGRAGDAQRALHLLIDLFGPPRLFLETSRTGSPREALVEPFLREAARRFRLRRVAADPVRALRPGEGLLMARLRSVAAPPRPEDPPDSFLAEGEVALPAPAEMERRYQDDPEPLRSAREIAERTRPFLADEEAPVRAGETDEIIRIALDELEKRYGPGPGGKRKEVEARFWEEFWGIEEGPLRAAILPLSGLFRALRRARPDLQVHTSFLSGSLLGLLTGLQEDGPDENEGLAPRADEDSPRILIEGDREGLSLARRLLEERLPGHLFPSIVPRPLDPAIAEKADRLFHRFSGEGSGPNPHPPTANPSGPQDRGTRGPDPLPKAEVERIAARALSGYHRDPSEIVWANGPRGIWLPPGGNRGALRIALRESPLLDTLRASASIEGEGDPFEILRRGAWVGILEGGLSLSRDLVEAIAPRKESDVALLLAAGADRGSRRDLVLKIAEIRAGKHPPTVSIARLAPILRETSGVPFFQEQMVAIIRNLTGCPERNAGTLFQDIRSRAGPRLARERSLFVRRAADRGVSLEVAGKIFSLLLAVAPEAPSRCGIVPLARRLLLAASRKSADPLRFAEAALNASLENRKRLLSLRAGFEREGVRFFPLDRNRSVFEFRVEEEGLRNGLAILPGLTRELAGRFVLDRERRGSFESDADLIRRLTDRGFPRAVLEEMARGLVCLAEAREPSPEVLAREAPLGRSYAGDASRRDGEHARPAA